MNVQIIGDGIDVDARIKEAVNTKLAVEIDKYLMDFEEDLKRATVRIEKLSHGGFKINFDMRLPGSNGHIYSEEEGRELLSVLVALRHEVERRVTNYKDKLQEYRR